MIIHIKKRGKFYYVENDDCYIFYYLFHYKINNKKCYFRKKYLDKVIFTLANKNLSFQVSDVCMYVCMYVGDVNYVCYLERGKEKLKFDKYLFELKGKLINKISSRNFNKFYREIIRKLV